MRILIVVGRFPQLSETFIFRKVVALAERGHEITVASRDPGDWVPFADFLPLPPNVRIQCLAPDTRLTNPARIWRAFCVSAKAFVSHPFSTISFARMSFGKSETWREYSKQLLRYIGFIGLQPDMIHFEFLGMASSYDYLPKLLGCEYVVSCRGADLNLFEIQANHQKEMIVSSLQNAVAVHAVSEAMKSTVERVAHRIDSVWVNRPAVDTRAILPNDRSSLISPPQILATGRLVWKKGFDYLLAVLARLRIEGIPFSARILGDGPLYSPLKFSIYDLGLEDSVKLCGAVSPREVLDHMQQASIFVLSSHEEGISNAVLEAMASGLPIVTTNAGGMAEAVRDGIDGFVVPVRDIDAMQNQIRRLLLDADLRLKMGVNARQRVETEFDIQRQADVFEAMYASVMTKNPVP